MLEYLSVIVCLLVALEKIPLYIGTLTLCYLASGSCFQVLTAAKLVLWNSYLEATEDEKEIEWARIADVFGLFQTLTKQ